MTPTAIAVSPVVSCWFSVPAETRALCPLVFVRGLGSLCVTVSKLPVSEVVADGINSRASQLLISPKKAAHRLPIFRPSSACDAGRGQPFFALRSGPTRTGDQTSESRARVKNHTVNSRYPNHVGLLPRQLAGFTARQRRRQWWMQW